MKPGIVWPTAMAAAILAVLVGLGTWQLHRLQFKQDLLAQIAAGEAAPPKPLGADPAPFSKISVSGRFRSDLSARFGVDVRETPTGRTMGTRLIVPIERPDGPPVLIDRGWVPAEPRTPIDMPDGTTTVVGFVRPAEHAGWFGVPDNPVERKFYTLDPLAIGKALGLARTEPFVIVAMGATPAAGFPDPAHAMPRPPNNHLSYVATWYGLAIVFVAIYGLWLRRRLKDAD